jgi:hypothetical protein
MPFDTVPNAGQNSCQTRPIDCFAVLALALLLRLSPSGNGRYKVASGRI